MFLNMNCLEFLGLCTLGFIPICSLVVVIASYIDRRLSL
jgi:hypothetical protein